MSKNITARQMGIKLELRPDDAMKQEILMAAKESHAAGRQGAPGIDYSDYLYIVSMLESGDVKKARLVLAFREQKAKERQEAIQRENMQLNSQMAQQQEILKSQQDLEKTYATRDADAQLEEKKAGLRMAERKSTAVDDMQKEEHKKNLEARNEKIKSSE